MPQFLPLCESAKRGEVCCDDLCRTALCGGLTLCGFDPEEWERMTEQDDDDCRDDAGAYEDD